MYYLQPEDMPILAATHEELLSEAADGGGMKHVDEDEGTQRGLLSRFCIERGHGSTRKVMHAQSWAIRALLISHACQGEGIFKPSP